ncbi:MAG: TonB-dependent receptor plug domain-containing protein [Chitinophagaceae bacterium]|nr:TonB-dependent receptor plug domain-containing protein [Chitinophagaceae bacterium]
MKRAGLFALLLWGVSGVNAQQQPASGSDTVKAITKLQITGTIKDAVTGKGVVGARLSVKNLSAAITDEEGAFKLTVADFYENVVITAEGYDSKQVSIKGKKVLNVLLLDASHSSYQDVVNLPLRSMPLREATAALTTYNANSEWKKPMETVDALLQGQVSGLNSIRRSGTPGVGANLYLRGYNSLFATNKPLIIVDGMIYDINDYGQSIIANNYTNPFALVNAQDIEDITVLKDAASIYGSKEQTEPF